MNIDSLKEKLDYILLAIRKDNPNANWRNLLTGVSILVLVGIFSMWYFSSSTSNADLVRDLKNMAQYDLNMDANATQGVDVTKESVASTSETTQVQKGEGLWHVAKRVCGDGEKYNYLAKANNLNLRRSRLYTGQTLNIDCGTN